MDISLWGEEFSISTLEAEKKALSKIKKLNSKKSVLDEKEALRQKMNSIKENVDRILGHRQSETQVIKSKQELKEYFDDILANKIVALDTETNNSLDPITCKLMGLCLYTPNRNQVYIPVNHVDPNTCKRLDWQVTEEDCKEQLERILSDVTIIYHNAKFDYQVIKCTCGVELPIHWDTMIGAKILDENEGASLKEQYIIHINPEQEKYSIENLFEKEEYAVFSPDLFALYAATDAVMTYELYLYQKKQFEQPDSKKLYKLFLDVEVPCIVVVAEMELTGIEIDLEYCKRLSNKYHKVCDELDVKIQEELHKYDDKVREWRLTSDATYKEPKKTKAGDGFQKSKSELLEDPVNLGSPAQLAIFLYDILGVPVVDPKKPRGTGKDELKAIYSKTKLEICNMILEWKKLMKLIDAFIDTLPNEVNPKTGRIHCNFNQIGASTGRFSSSNPNLQQIPSKSKDIRLMFKAGDREEDIECKNNQYELSIYDDVLTKDGWKLSTTLSTGEIILGDDNQEIVKDITINDKRVIISVEQKV